MSGLFQADSLIEAACLDSGLDDFGDDSFREGLSVYCTSLEAEAELNEVGTLALQSNLIGSLVNRLRVIDWSSSHSLADEAIESPVFVIGLFRAGTTLLGELLDLDPNTRSLLGWESTDSVPPPTPDTHRRGDRVDAARARASMLDALNPELKAIHHEEPDGPTECITLLAQDFKALLWESIANVASYGRWLMQADHTPAYAYHRLCLQVLQSGGVGGRWCLKSPHHALALTELTTVYPDARLVYLHRDPVSVASSACSLIRCLSGTFSDADHGAYIAKRWTEVLVQSVTRVDRFRAKYPEHPVLDVHYAHLTADPMAVLERVYEFAGLSCTPATVAAAEGYLKAHPRGRFGAHRYDPAALGLNVSELRGRFADYIERYGVQQES